MKEPHRLVDEPLVLLVEGGQVGEEVRVQLGHERDDALAHGVRPGRGLALEPAPSIGSVGVRGLLSLPEASEGVHH